jgi:hypothetical protein
VQCAGCEGEAQGDCEEKDVRFHCRQLARTGGGARREE